jgi:hypothetical protein
VTRSTPPQPHPEQRHTDRETETEVANRDESRKKRESMGCCGSISLKEEAAWDEKISSNNPGAGAGARAATSSTPRPASTGSHEQVEKKSLGGGSVVRENAWDEAEEEAARVKDARQKAEEEAALEASRLAEEEARVKAAAEEEDARVEAAAEEARLKAEAEEVELRMKADEEEARLKKDAEDEEARVNAAAEEEATRLIIAAEEEEARVKAAAEEEATRLMIAAEEEEARVKAVAEEAQVEDEEEARLKKGAEMEDLRIKAEDEEKKAIGNVSVNEKQAIVIEAEEDTLLKKTEVQLETCSEDDTNHEQDEVNDNITLDEDARLNSSYEGLEVDEHSLLEDEVQDIVNANEIKVENITDNIENITKDEEVNVNTAAEDQTRVVASDDEGAANGGEMQHVQASSNVNSPTTKPVSSGLASRMADMDFTKIAITPPPRRLSTSENPTIVTTPDASISVDDKYDEDYNPKEVEEQFRPKVKKTVSGGLAARMATLNGAQMIMPGMKPPPHLLNKGMISSGDSLGSPQGSPTKSKRVDGDAATGEITNATLTRAVASATKKKKKKSMMPRPMMLTTESETAIEVIPLQEAISEVDESS